MRFNGYKTKALVTLGLYVFFWHRHVVLWLRQEFGVAAQGQETWRLFVPFYSLIVWWKFLALVRAVEASTLGAADIQRGIKPLSVGRAFFWSSMWFNAGPYVNRHLNALAAFRRGQAVPQPALAPA